MTTFTVAIATNSNGVPGLECFTYADTFWIVEILRRWDLYEGEHFLSWAKDPNASVWHVYNRAGNTAAVVFRH